MSIPLDWLRDVSWTTTIYDVVVQYPITVPATYRVTVIPLDANEPGASPELLQIGFYLKDFVGHAYTIRAINVDGDPTRIIVSDDFLCGDGPQTAQTAFIYESVDQGTSPYLAPINHERLDHSALDYTRAIELAILWRKILSVGTSLDVVISSIDNYEYWRLKGATGTKTPTFGALYNAFSATSLKGIAPAGYRVPTSDEILSLIEDNGYSPECNELRDTGILFWTGPNDGSNTSEFTLRGNGYRDNVSGTFLGLMAESRLWTVTPGDTGDEAMLYIQPADVAPSIISSPKVDGAGIRLIRDNIEGWVEGEVWTTSNLITEHFQDGTKINLEEDSTKWFALIAEGICYYSNDPTLGYVELPAEDLRINKHDLLNIQDTDTIKWRIVKISDTEARIVADSTIKPAIPQVQADWTETDETALDFIKHKPAIPAAQIQSNWNETDIEALDFILNKPEIPAEQIQSNWAEEDPAALDFILNKPEIPAAQIQSNWNQTDTTALDYIQNKPEIGGGEDTDVQANWEETDTAAPDFILNKPTIPAAQVQSDWTETDSSALDFILNKPTVIDGVSSYTYIAYASDAIGTGFTNVFDSSLNYIAIKTTTTPLTTPVVTDFTGLWKNYKGSDGAAGATIELQIATGYIQWRPVGTSTWYNLIATSTLVGAPGGAGSPGAAGAASYTYIAYASDAIGTGFTNTFNSALNYIAILTTTAPIATPIASNFAGLWKNYKGADSPDVFDVYISFLSVTPFVYDCPYALQFNSQISESTAATISPALGTAMAQFGKVTVTPAVIGLVILKGVLL